MKKHYYLLPALALGLASCSDADLNNQNPDQSDLGSSEIVSNLNTVRLSTFGGDPNRITYGAGTRAEGDDENAPKTLELLASIANPSKGEGFDYPQQEGGRYLSATSVFYDARENKYYATYHMQGNNYNTDLENEIGGAIQWFTVDDNGLVDLGTGFRAADPGKQDFDFNHIYFDVTSNRIVTVGHVWDLPKTWTSEDPFTGERNNTHAIIGEMKSDGTFTYATISTGEKMIDPVTNQSLGDEDAGDANCVIRAGDTNDFSLTAGWNFYYVATRKGLAVVRAEEDHLFEPAVDNNGKNFFVKTPGSAKHVAKTGTTSYFKLLYLAEDKDNNSYSQHSKAKIAQFATNTAAGNTFGSLQGQHSPFNRFDPSTSIIDFYDQVDLEEYEISPIDGKNTIIANPGNNSHDDEMYAALGTGGMFYQFNGINTFTQYRNVLKFKGENGYLPVNCVTADVASMESGHEGFIYVACGARLIILHRGTFDVVAYWNIPTKDQNGDYLENVGASANYIHVEKGPAKDDRSPRERIITVAYGQEGLKVFRFNPATLDAFTVREKELPSEIVCK